jgi:hypothetical protein
LLPGHRWYQRYFINPLRYIRAEIPGDGLVFNAKQAHVTVYNIIDDALVSSSVPRGAKGAIFAVIDGLRSEPNKINELRKAEQISLALHGLEAALRRSDEEALRQARRDLQSLASAWIDMRVRSLRPTERRCFA